MEESCILLDGERERLRERERESATAHRIQDGTVKPWKKAPGKNHRMPGPEGLREGMCTIQQHMRVLISPRLLIDQVAKKLLPKPHSHRETRLLMN